MISFLTTVAYLLMALFGTILFFSFLISAYRYIIDGGDLRTCFVAQAVLFVTITVYKIFCFITYGEYTYSGFILVRLHLLIASYLLLNCKLIGFKFIFTSSSTKNLIFTLSGALFFIAIFISVISIDFQKLIIGIYNGAPIKDLGSRVVIAVDIFKMNIFKDGIIGNIGQYSQFVYPIISFTTCCVIDIMEKRSQFTKITNFLLVLPIIAIFILRFTPLNYSTIALNYSMLILYFSITFILFTRESFDIFYHTIPYDENYKTVVKILRNARKEKGKLSSKTKAQAKIIARIMKLDEDLLNKLPLTKADEPFIYYIEKIIKNENM